MRVAPAIFCILFFLSDAIGQHPVAYCTNSEIISLKQGISLYPSLSSSFREMKAAVDPFIGKEVDVPLPKDAAGGYTHDKHKANYTLMFNAGLLYQLTGNKEYAELVRKMFLKYAALNPALTKHPQATTNSPGRLFWQALNDANWLVYTGIAFDCIHHYLSVSDRQKIAEGAFKPEVDFFTKDLRNWFDIIHNQALWACAGIGIVGIATDNNDYINIALKGTSLTGKYGFWANLDQLFSPDGYYVEGPYYARYALLPVYLFANALNNKFPQYKVFAYRDSILQKALSCALQQTNLDGSFYGYNDALKDKTFFTNEIVEALNISRKAYGKDITLLPVAKLQSRVTLSKGGMLIASDLATIKNIPAHLTYRSVEYTDGASGDKGGVSILRSGRTDSLTSLIFKYASHGMGHGHFDRLNINLYDNGHEILQDYGAVRFINIEQKWGGRYLPETKTFAQQTIAHNTIAVDGASDFNANENASEQYTPVKLFSNIKEPYIQVVSAAENRAYNGVGLHRTLYMLSLKEYSKPLIVDVFKANSNTVHQYDLPFYYLGNLINTNFRYTYFGNGQTTLGAHNGYQYLWKEAEAPVVKGTMQFTFLQHNTYYSISSLGGDSTSAYFARIGANDSSFNLRREPAYIIRKKGNNETFVNVIEAHGNFNPTTEISANAYPSVKHILLLRDDEQYTVLKIELKQAIIRIAQSNTDTGTKTQHSININGEPINWSGPYTIQIFNQTTD